MTRKKIKLKENAKNFLATEEVTKENKWEQYIMRSDVKDIQIQNELRRKPIAASSDRLVPVKTIYENAKKEKEIKKQNEVLKDILKDQLVKK